MNLNLKILTEAGNELGFGHLFRMRSILQVCDFAKIFVHTNQNINLEENEISCQWRDLDWISNNITKEDFIVLDSYLCTIEEIELLESKSKYLLVIDDNKIIEYTNKNIMNPNLFGSNLSYDDSNSLFVGKEYALTRKEFFYKDIKVEKNVLIMFGGSDVLNITSLVANYCKKFGYNIRVVEGEKTNSNLSDPEIKMYKNLGPEELSSLMQEATVIISSAGQTLNEIVKVQKPAVIISVIDNQIPNKNYYIENNYMLEFTKDNLEQIDYVFDPIIQEELKNKLKEIYTKETGSTKILELFNKLGEI
ncbi:MAG: hypothetical protein ACK5KQ_02890 [Anaerorhabdus sp.]